MNEQDRFKEIAKVAADANESVLKIVRTLVDYDIVINDLSDLAYQLGYIEGLSYARRRKMKIKVDKEEHERLLEKVDYLEEEIRHTREHMFENWRWTREELYEMMEHYFKTQCISVIVKRDKDMVVGEVRKNAMDNLFKEN